MLKIKQIMQDTVTKGGCTPTVKGRYIVGLEEDGEIFNIENSSSIRKCIARFINSGITFGTWLHDKKIYIDKNVQLNDLEEAIKLGRENHQIAIYDYKENKEILL